LWSACEAPENACLQSRSALASDLEHDFVEENRVFYVGSETFALCAAIFAAVTLKFKPGSRIF
jgi:hypothetical protein